MSLRFAVESFAEIYSHRYCLALVWTVFYDYDLHCEGIDVNTDPNIECCIAILECADEVAPHNATTADANIRLNILSRGFLEAASMDRRVDKTKLIHIHPKLKESAMTMGDMDAVGFTYKCPDCPRTFPTKFPRGFALLSFSECRYNGHNCHYA